MSPVEVTPAFRFWPPPSSEAWRSNSGSAPPPCDWNGPESVTLTGPLSWEFAALRLDRDLQVDVARLDLLRARERVGQELVDVGARRRGLAAAAVVVAASTGTHGERERREPRQQESRTAKGHRETGSLMANRTAAGCVAAGGEPEGDPSIASMALRRTNDCARIVLLLALGLALVSTPTTAQAAKKKTIATELRKLYRAGSIDQATYDADRAILADVKRRIKRLTGTRRYRARRRPGHDGGDRRARQAARLAAAAAVPPAPAQRRVLDGLAAARRAARASRSRAPSSSSSTSRARASSSTRSRTSGSSTRTRRAPSATTRATRCCSTS